VSRETAPLWHAFLDQVLVYANNARYKAKNPDEAERKAHTQKYVVTCFFLRARRRSTSNWFASALGNYLHLNGTKKRAIGVLSGLGLITNSKTVGRNLDADVRWMKVHMSAKSKSRSK